MLIPERYLKVVPRSRLPQVDAVASDNARSFLINVSCQILDFLTARTLCFLTTNLRRSLHPPHRQTSQFHFTMAANEVNDIVIRLMAVADRIGGRERDDLMHYAGRLSRAATRERNAAVDEIQRLRKKIVQQGAELRRLDNLVKSAQEPFAPQPPLVGSHYGAPITVDCLLTRPHRPEDMDASMRAVFGPSTVVLRLTSTTALATVVCRALRACRSRCGGPRRQPLLLRLTASSGLHLPMSRSLSVRATLSRTSLGTVSSTQHASSHFSLTLRPRRCRSQVQATSAPRCQMGRHLRDTQSQLRMRSPWRLVVRSVVLSQPKGTFLRSRPQISCSMRLESHRTKPLARSVGHLMMIPSLRQSRGKLQLLQCLPQVLTRTRLLSMATQRCPQAMTYRQYRSYNAFSKVAQLAARCVSFRTMVPTLLSCQIPHMRPSTTFLNLLKSHRSELDHRLVPTASRSPGNATGELIAVNAIATNVSTFFAIRRHAWAPRA